jgi:Tfp pilus assembly protein PilN
MFNYLKNIEILKSNRAIGLHCNVNGGSNPVFSYVILVRKKGKVEIESQAEIQCEFEKLHEVIPTKYPVYLSIDGKGILHKQIENDPSKSAIQMAIPNANENDFVYELFNGTSQKKYISFTRKEFIDEILAKLSAQKFQVIGLTISPFSCLGLFEIFHDLPSTIIVGNFELELDRATHEIISFCKLDMNVGSGNYSIGDSEISSAMLLPFYNCLTYYTNRSGNDDYPVVSSQKTEFVSKRLFEIAGAGILIFLFIILLVNFVIFSNYTEEKQKLDENVSANKELITRLNHVKEELSWKEKFIGQAGTDRKNWFSFFADRIGASVPDEITLEKLDFHPIRSKIINQKEIELQADRIRIEGITKSSSAVNDWTLILKKMAGVSDVIIGSFSQMENSTVGVFALEIRLKTPEN